MARGSVGPAMELNTNGAYRHLTMYCTDHLPMDCVGKTYRTMIVSHQQVRGPCAWNMHETRQVILFLLQRLDYYYFNKNYINSFLKRSLRSNLEDLTWCRYERKIK